MKVGGQGWAGPTAGTDRCGKSRSQPGFDPRTDHLVASRYTDDAILRYICYCISHATLITRQIHDTQAMFIRTSLTKPHSYLL